MHHGSACLRDGGVQVTSYHDPAAGASHAAFSPLSTADVIATYLRGQAIGNPAARVRPGDDSNYDPTRAADGMLTFKVEGQGDGFGLEWGIQPRRTKPCKAHRRQAPANGTSLPTMARRHRSAQADLAGQVAVTGTSYTVTIQDSADNSSFTNVTGLSFTAVSAAPAAQRIATANNATIRRYVRAVTTGTFSVASFQVTIVKNATAGVVF